MALVDQPSVVNIYTLLQEPASINDDMQRHLGFYHPGTRTWVFDKLNSWSRNEKQNNAFWVNGTGGLGKSVIAAEYLRRARDDKSHFTAAVGFFCRHNDATRNDPQSAVLNLAYQLAQQLEPVKSALLQGRENIRKVVSDASTDLVELFDLLMQLAIGKDRQW